MTRWSVVVPSNRPERIASFLEAWDGQFTEHAVELIIVDDTLSGDISKMGIDANVARDADRNVWVMSSHESGYKCIPTGTDQCRSLGFLFAYKHLGTDFILSLDDDVTPGCYDLFATYEETFDAGAPFSPYLNVGALTSYGKPMRGFPKNTPMAEVVVQWGGWEGVLDYYAETQLDDPDGTSEYHTFGQWVVPIPVGAAVTGCAMNMAFRRSWAPYMWQLPLHEGRYNRWGDIWSGLIVKRLADAHGKVCVINGRAVVEHQRASDPHANLARETPGHALNDGLWDAFISRWGGEAAPESGHWELLWELVVHACKHDPAYAEHLEVARAEWWDLCHD